MSRILELDVFAPKPDIISYKGKQYEVKPIQVQGLLQVMASFQELQGLENAESLTPEEQTKMLAVAEKAMTEVASFISSKIEGLPVDELTVPGIAAILQFMSESAAGVVDVEEAAKDDPEKKVESPPSESETTSQE